MHTEILNTNQIELLPFVVQFKREYYLVGGTAIALHIGHRISIDFDLFKQNKINENKIYKVLQSYPHNYKMTYRNAEQINFIINDVKFTFFSYLFNIKPECELKGTIKMPDLLTLAAMKAFALGRRTKWKDYVDLFFIIKYHYSIEQISEKANEIYGELFSSKLFRMQLPYFTGIDYTDEVIYIIPNPPSDEEIKKYLTDVCLIM